MLFRSQVKEIRRRKMLVEHLLYGLEYKTHASSSHFWIPVPEPRRASEIESELQQQNYLVATAENFAVGHDVVPQFIRARAEVRSVGKECVSTCTFRWAPDH